MNLKLVTWECDLTQFLVDADNGDPVSLAIEGNRIFDEENYKYDPKDEDDVIHIEDRNNPNTYEVWDIDFEDLGPILERNDYMGRYGTSHMFCGG